MRLSVFVENYPTFCLPLILEPFLWLAESALLSKVNLAKPIFQTFAPACHDSKADLDGRCRDRGISPPPPDWPLITWLREQSVPIGAGAACPVLHWEAPHVRAIHVVAKPEVCRVVQAEEWAQQDELRVVNPRCFHVYIYLEPAQRAKGTRWNRAIASCRNAQVPTFLPVGVTPTSERIAKDSNTFKKHSSYNQTDTILHQHHGIDMPR